MCNKPKIPTPPKPPVVQPAPVLEQAAPDVRKSNADDASRAAEGTKSYRANSSLSIGKRKPKSGVNIRQ